MFIISFNMSLISVSLNQSLSIQLSNVCWNWLFKTVQLRIGLSLDALVCWYHKHSIFYQKHKIYHFLYPFFNSDYVSIHYRYFEYAMPFGDRQTTFIRSGTIAERFLRSICFAWRGLIWMSYYRCFLRSVCFTWKGLIWDFNTTSVCFAWRRLI